MSNGFYGNKRAKQWGTAFSVWSAARYMQDKSSVPGGNKYRNLALLVGGVSKIETINYAHESSGTRIWERLRWRCSAKTEKYRPDFSSERAPHINKLETVKKIIKESMGKFGRGSQMGAWYQDGLADWLSVVIFFLSPFLFASCTNASTFSKWCDGRRGRERGAHQHPSVIKGAKQGVEVGNRNTHKLTN
jgi:hypothetical protein